MKIIFLDIDGVLNHSRFLKERAPSCVMGISDELVLKLKQIVGKTDAKIVLISTWKDIWEKDENLCEEDALYLNKKLKMQDLFVHDKTLNEFVKDRGLGIHEYLLNNNVENFVILDDYDNEDFEKYDLKRNFIKVNRRTGLSDDDVEKAVKILNNI